MPLVRLCMVMETGEFRHFPQSGSALDQHPLLLACLRASWYTWYINEYKPARQIPVTQQDSEWMQEILPPDYQPKSHYNKHAVKDIKR